MSTSELSLWEMVRPYAGHLKPEAFNFIQEGLRHTVEKLFDRIDDDELEGKRHVTGQQLCMGLREFAIDQYGLLARTVLEHWGFRRTEDFGKAVFAMVEAGLMRKTDQDSLDDFSAVFDFDEAFSRELERC